MTTFTPNNKWNISNEYIGVNKDRKAKFSLINSNNKMLNCDFIPEERIGSESTMGEVYKIKVKNINAAVKILPVINDSSIKNNQKEIDIAKELSNLVLNNQSIHFPIVYFDLHCDSTYFYEHQKSKFATKSLNYQLYKKLINSLLDESVIDNIESLYKTNTSISQILKDIKVYDMIDDTKISSDLLFSELAYCDLFHFIKTLIYEYDINIRNQIIKEIIYQVLEGIKDMQNRGIVHNDLHLGNILLLYKPYISDIKEIEDIEDKIIVKDLIILIHDFGKSSKNIKLSNIQKRIDVQTFMIEFNKHYKTNFDNIIEMLDNNFDIYDIVKLYQN
jgi:serine/threonine protein kinase